MIPTTALLTEFLVVGAIAWLWIMPIVMSAYRLSAQNVVDYLGSAPAPHLLIIVFVTYVIGVFTESLSFAVEKFAVGATSSPRSWYTRHVAKMKASDWHAAQDRMWSSETAFKEFKQTGLRSSISRGAFCNSLLILGVLAVVAMFGFWISDYFPILWVALFLVIVSPLSWWFAQAEHTARVRVAGEIEAERVEERANTAVDSTATRVTPPAEQEPRHGQP